MRKGEKIEFAHEGQTYQGIFLEEQLDLLDPMFVQYRVGITSKESRAALGLIGSTPMIINQSQVFFDAKSKKKAIKLYSGKNKPSESPELILNEVPDTKVEEQFDMFGEPVRASRPRLR